MFLVVKFNSFGKAAIVDVHYSSYCFAVIDAHLKFNKGLNSTKNCLLQQHATTLQIIVFINYLFYHCLHSKFKSISNVQENLLVQK